MTDERYNALISDEALELTEAELREGWHFCIDWDGLLIGPGMMEVNHCACAKPPNRR
jgi:hypothetical protein